MNGDRMRSATLLLLAIALVGCREAQPEHEPATVVTPDARPAGSPPPGVSGGAEGTAEGLPDPFPYALATNRRIDIEMRAWLAEQQASVEAARWTESQATPQPAPTESAVVSNARVEGERPIPPAGTSPVTGAVNSGANAGSNPAPSATTSLRAAIEASQWPPHEWLAVEQVVMCESSGSTTARNGPHAGLLQMNEGLHGAVPAGAVAQLNDAYELWLVAGWSAWECA